MLQFKPVQWGWGEEEGWQYKSWTLGMPSNRPEDSRRRTLTSTPPRHQIDFPHSMTSEYLPPNDFQRRSHEDPMSGSTSLIRRSWHVMTELFTQRSPLDAVSLPTGNLPRNPEGLRQRSTRADRIPETEADDEAQRPTVRDYHSINAVPPRVRVPKKIATPIQVEGKVCWWLWSSLDYI